VLLTALRIKNYKCIHDVEIYPETDRFLMLLAGPNMAGKTSIIEAIEALHGGKDAVVADPVRHGEALAKIEGEYDNGLSITRSILPDGETTLVVKDSTGKVRSPQALLDKLLGQRLLDPLKFRRLSANEQREMLLEIIDKEKRLAGMDAEHQRVFDSRTEVGRKLKDAEGELHRLGPMDEVGELVDVAELAKERSAMADEQRAGDGLHNEMKRASDAHAIALRELEASDVKIRELERQIAAERERRTKLAADVGAAKAQLDERQAKRDAAIAAWAAKAPRATEIDAMLANANQINKAVVEARALNDRRVAAQKVVDDRKRGYSEGTALLEKIEAKKLAFLAAAKLPVPGLGLEPQGKGKLPPGLTLNGVPLAQASGAEQLRVALAIAIASQSEIADILIRDASLLDDTSLRMVEEVAMAAGRRVWLERVGTRDPGAIIIREGKIAASSAE
jgi:recombinational DNA repair ATPase RecF